MTTATTGVTLGFIGLGTMGSAMAMRLVEAGADPLVWNRGPAALAPFRAAGARVADSAAAVIAGSAMILLMLADDDAVGEVLGLADPARRRALAGRIVVNMGTGSPEAALAHRAAVEGAGGTYCEAPVSGSRQPALEGRLVALVAGGSEAQRALVRRVMAPLCRASVDAGAVPAGLRMKLAINLYLVTTVAALAEAFHCAEALGIELDRFAALVEAGPMASEVAVGKGRKIAAGDFAAQASIRDVHKNCRLIAEAAHHAGASTPLLDEALALYAAREAAGDGARDMAAVFASYPAPSPPSRQGSDR